MTLPLLSLRIRISKWLLGDDIAEFNKTVAAEKDVANHVATMRVTAPFTLGIAACVKSLEQASKLREKGDSGKASLLCHNVVAEGARIKLAVKTLTIPNEGMERKNLTLFCETMQRLANELEAVEDFDGKEIKSNRRSIMKLMAMVEGIRKTEQKILWMVGEGSDLLVVARETGCCLSQYVFGES